MGFFKNLFSGKEISAEEQMRRMGNVKPKETEKPVSEMNEDEMIDYWGRARELTDVHERMRRMEALADAGFGVACLDMFDAYMELADPDDLPFDKLEYWARRAADFEIPRGYLHLGMIYTSPKNPDASIMKAAPEYLKAMEYGEEQAGEFLQPYWNHERRDGSEEEKAEHREIMHAMISEVLQPEIDRLQEEESEKTYRAFGLLCYYGIYFEQNLDEAKNYFAKLADMGDYFGKRMMENSIFADDDEDEE